MRRTHVMHKRDNRRSFPSHYQTPAQDTRPTIVWVRHGAGNQVLEIDGKSFAEIRPYGEPRWDILGDCVQPHTARILSSDSEVQFNSCDSARAFCERCAATF